MIDLKTMNNDADAVARLGSVRKDLLDELQKVIIGQEDILDQLLITLFSRGHGLLVGIPGLAKTLMISSLSKVLDLKFNRIQFTPDLMPSDIIGTDVIEDDAGKKTFRFVHGPVFSQILLADEINRTPPKTQSALLEAMQEHRVTASGHSYTLQEPFFVLATQNPIEQEGTYPLPEAQLDRFMFNLWVDYPTTEQEIAIVKATTSAKEVSLRKILTGDDIIFFQNLIRRVPVADELVKYAVELVNKTRPKSDHSPKFIKDWLSWGAGPRASQYLILGAKAKCALEGRFTPDMDDVKAVVKPVLRHRLVTNFNAEADGISTTDVIEKLLNDHSK